MLDPSWNVNGFRIEKENAFRNRIKMGAGCLLASGVFTVAGLLLRGPILDPSTQSGLFAGAAASSRHIWAWSFLLPSLVIQLYGFLGLYGFLAGSSRNRLAWTGFVLSVGGNGLFLPFAGVIAFVTPAVARLYLMEAPFFITQ